MTLTKVIALVVYYFFARHLPTFDYRLGMWARPVRHCKISDFQEIPDVLL